ncbi:hypothetical protein M2319_002106 [Rhodobium gokarnense]|uniref:Uncharacterized protein n=1 Tax=Rhodobium gokarnense TaxID=364296 RepID=A0ABT3HBQ3_9HYPH|nr:hypothetical protein [Rhodobium gokarnense]
MAYGCSRSRDCGPKLGFRDSLEYHVVVVVFIAMYLLAAPFMALIRRPGRNRNLGDAKRPSLLARATSAAQIAAGYAFMR